MEIDMKTHIIIIADVSGSMTAMKDIPQQKLNQFIKEQSSDVLIDYWIFSNTHKLIFQDKKSNEIFIKYDVTNGSTALYSTIGNIIDITSIKFSNLESPPDRVIFVIYTDGEENASEDIYRGESGRILVKNKIEQCQSINNWIFLFLGTNIDAIHTGTNIGISQQTCINYDSSESGYNNVFKSASSVINKFKSTNIALSHEEIIKKVAFTEVDRICSMYQDIQLDEPVTKRMKHF